MQKRNLVIFSLLVVSILLIAGCQQTVGGTSVNRRATYSATDSTYSTSYNNLDITVGLSSCQGIPFNYAYIGSEVTGYECHEVKGCINLDLTTTSTSFPKPIAIYDKIIIYVPTGIEIPCAQSSKGSVPKLTNEEALGSGLILIPGVIKAP